MSPKRIQPVMKEHKERHPWAARETPHWIDTAPADFGITHQQHTWIAPLMNRLPLQQYDYLIAEARKDPRVMKALVDFGEPLQLSGRHKPGVMPVEDAVYRAGPSVAVALVKHIGDPRPPEARKSAEKILSDISKYGQPAAEAYAEAKDIASARRALARSIRPRKA